MVLLDKELQVVDEMTETYRMNQGKVTEVLRLEKTGYILLTVDDNGIRNLLFPHIPVNEGDEIVYSVKSALPDKSADHKMVIDDPLSRKVLKCFSEIPGTVAGIDDMSVPAEIMLLKDGRPWALYGNPPGPGGGALQNPQEKYPNPLQELDEFQMAETRPSAVDPESIGEAMQKGLEDERASMRRWKRPSPTGKFSEY